VGGVALLSNHYVNDHIPEGMGSLSGNLWGMSTPFSLPFSLRVSHYLQKQKK